ncbi:MAG: hypothetical protein IT452_09325 [Planctomycetia bacterium]|nr:hypothetical protein [Planctomycetia bacterium]
MLLRCRKCNNTYDVSGKQPGETFKSQCGDILVVPQRGEHAPALVAGYVERYAKESGVALQKNGEVWFAKFGSAQVTLQMLTGDEIRISSPFLNLPKKGTQLALRRILELNFSATGAARFALEGGQLFVVWSRGIEGLDYEEFVEGLRCVSRTSDDFDDVLRKEWGMASAEQAQDTEEYVLPAELLEEEKA